MTPEQLQASALLNKVLAVYGEIQNIGRHPGSLIDVDDRYMARHGSSMQALVIHRLLSVMDHLQLATYTLARLPQPLVFSQFTLIRSALAGAATSLWIIDPPEFENRRIRALKLACYDIDQYVNFANAALRDPAINSVEKAGSREIFRNNLETMTMRRRNIYEEICAYESNLGKTKMPSVKGIGTINEVAIVQAAGKRLEELGRMPSGIHAELQYRILSGFVHNCIWASQVGANATSQEMARDGMYATTTERLEGNFHNVYNGAITAFEIARLASSRFEELLTTPR
ncbi:Uncharacterised protein [Mycobacteroides abscessus subsp. bolletii]|nr:Uncharacterised protein [Mycobacteroides abscessus subsp. bolletii]SKH26153.1 Uncharacterised protein [Mycobacteroides abscessus subsp. bolletii]